MNPSKTANLRWRRIAAGALGGLVLVLGAAALLLSSGRPTVDDDMLAFDVVDVEGNPVSLTSERFAGKVVLLDIWGLWCPPCIQQIPHLIDLQKRYGPHGLEIIGVEFASYLGNERDEYTGLLREWAKEQGINYTVVQGGEMRDVESVFPALRNFGGFPTTVLIGRDGHVRAITQGFASSEMRRFEDMIKRLLREPAPQQGQNARADQTGAGADVNGVRVSLRTDESRRRRPRTSRRACCGRHP